MGPSWPECPRGHSHAFQRAMAGTAERRTGGDDFWSWRESMYAAATLDPDPLRAAARNAYAEMLLAGYNAVAEFHYLHRDPHGAWYADRAAMSRALIAAAADAGIAICPLPALYAQSDAAGAPLGPRQRRFAADAGDVLAIAAGLRADTRTTPASWSASARTRSRRRARATARARRCVAARRPRPRARRRAVAQ